MSLAPLEGAGPEPVSESFRGQLEHSRPAKAISANLVDGYSNTICVVLHEGRKRVIRRMMSRLGYPVKHLRRVRTACLTMPADLGVGSSRRLTDIEVSELKTYAEGMKKKIEEMEMKMEQA